MKTKYLISIAVVLVVLIAGILIFSMKDSGEDFEDNVNLPDSVSEEDNVVLMSVNGFEPNTLAIKKGETVTFVNVDMKARWPASAFHPTHEEYPGSGVGHCGGSKQNEIFDACRGLSQNETYSFTFNYVGEWKYHDHINPSRTGTIFVTE